MEGYANAGTLNGSAGNSAPVGGRRGRKSRSGSKKVLRVVKKSTVRNMLKKKGLKMRGGGEDGTGAVSGGRRSRRRTHRRRGFSLF